MQQQSLGGLFLHFYYSKSGGKKKGKRSKYFYLFTNCLQRTTKGDVKLANQVNYDVNEVYRGYLAAPTERRNAFRFFTVACDVRHKQRRLVYTVARTNTLYPVRTIVPDILVI